MAIKTKATRLSVNLTAIVDNAIVVTKQVRQTEQARMEAKFQQAVAGGMSYEAQLKFRQDQLKEEGESAFSDPEYSEQLKTAIATTQKLSRFEKIRIKYKSSLDDYTNGRGTLDSHIALLERELEGENDPTMDEELRGLLSEAQKEKTTIAVNAIKNRAVLAQKDTSLQLIAKSIDEVTAKKALASLNENDDEVAMWDDTLLALKGSESKLKIENGMNDIQFQITHKALKSTDKVNLLTKQLYDADETTPVTYGGVTYPSMKAYWQNQSDTYIASDYFRDVESELAADTATMAASSQFGQIPAARIDSVSRFYNDLKVQPAFAAYVDKIDGQRVAAVNAMVTDLASALYDEANAHQNDPDFGNYIAKTETSLIGLETKFGVTIARQPFAKEVAAGKTVLNSVATGLEDINKMDANNATAEAVGRNASEIARAGDVYNNADRLAGTGKYANQTAQQIRDNAHAYAEKLRAGTATPTPPVAEPTVTPATPTTPAEIKKDASIVEQPKAQAPETPLASQKNVAPPVPTPVVAPQPTATPQPAAEHPVGAPAITPEKPIGKSPTAIKPTVPDNTAEHPVTFEKKKKTNTF